MKKWYGGAAALGMVLLLSVPAGAQQRWPGAPGMSQSEAALFIGVSQLDIGELNTRLTQFGYPAFDSNFPQVGLTWATTRQRVRLGVEFAGGGRPSEVRGDGRYRSELSAAYAMFNVGVRAIQQGSLAVHPKLGIGGGGVNLTITDRQPATFDQILAQPGRNVIVTQGSLLLDASIGATYRLGPDAMARGGRSLMLGARIGYTQSLLHGGWTELRNDAPGGPDAGWGGPHVEFLIGRSTRR